MTSEAPKEIWLGHGKAYIVPVHGTTPYTLTTHAQAMVAAEREACAVLCDTKDFWDFREKAAALHIGSAIRARTNADAQAALDALLKAEREAGRVDGLREAAGAIVLIGDRAVTEALGQRLCCDGYHCGCKGALVEDYITHTILTLIEKETGHE